MFHKVRLDRSEPVRRLSASRARRLSAAAVLTALLLGQQSAAAETRDSIAPATADHERTVMISPAHDAETEASRRALEGFTALLGAGDVQGAFEQYTTPSYTQHMAGVAPGRAGAIAYIQDELARGGRASILKVIAEGNWVALHMRQTFSNGSPDREIIEWWRVDNGRLAEHWGVGENISGGPAS